MGGRGRRAVELNPVTPLLTSGFPLADKNGEKKGGKMGKGGWEAINMAPLVLPCHRTVAQHMQGHTRGEKKKKEIVELLLSPSFLTK